MADLNRLFENIPAVIVNQPFEREHALILQAYHRFHRPILVPGFIPTAAIVNEAIKWWNENVAV